MHPVMRNFTMQRVFGLAITLRMVVKNDWPSDVQFAPAHRRDLFCGDLQLLNLRAGILTA
jgi:hypothetical protein